MKLKYLLPTHFPKRVYRNNPGVRPQVDKEDEILSLVTTWMDSKWIMLSKISQTRTNSK